MYPWTKRLAILLVLAGGLFWGVSGCFPFAWAKTYMVPMRDGVKLATDAYVPRHEGKSFPTIVVRTVYGRDTKGNKELARAWMDRGYAFVIQDTRGRFGSGGKEKVFADDGWSERQDGADTIAWTKQQSWCNGMIATSGGSALGLVQVLLAPATHDVKAQSIVVAASNFYGQLSYQGAYSASRYVKAG